MHLIGQALPGIANVQCSRLRFEPGDRVIVRTISRLDNDQKKKLKKSITKWAGAEVEILIVCLLDFDIEVEKKCQKKTLVLGK